MTPSTKKQRQLIAIGCGQLGISADLRHEMLQDRYGVASSTLLSRAQADAFLRELKSRGFSVRPGNRKSEVRSRKSAVPRSGGNAVRMVSPEELAKLTAVAGLIDWQYEDGFKRWMKKRFGLDRVRTAGQAWRVIEGLKKMFENHMRKSIGPDWWTGNYRDPEIRMYIREHCPEKYRVGEHGR